MRRGAERGARGERIAERHLCSRAGFVVLERNWRSPLDRRDEIDLVCRDGEVLVFVEVKARAAGSLVPGYHAIGGNKKAALRRAARAYLARLRPAPLTFRLDVVEVTLPAIGAEVAAADVEVLHFENVPLFGKHFRG